MKKLILAIWILGVSCSQPQKEILVSVLDDTTEKEMSAFQPSDILTYFDLERNQWNNLCFRYQSLTGSDYNKVKTLEILAETQLFSNNIERRNKLKAFQKDIQNCKKDSNQGYEKSSIFIPLIKEIEYLNNHYPNRSIQILVYSNLMDNTDWVSWYDPYTKNNEKTLVKYQAHFPKIEINNTIEVKVIFTPTAKENKRFREIVTLYTKLFQDIGISFRVGASI
jgi:hypothetical protein